MGATDFRREHGVELERMERESLRRQLDLMEDIRNRMRREPADAYDAWADALMDLTDDILWRLMELECGGIQRRGWNKGADYWIGDRS